MLYLFKRNATGVKLRCEHYQVIRDCVGDEGEKVTRFQTTSEVHLQNDVL